MKRFYVLTAIFFLLVEMSTAQAGVILNEIMYDVAGSDTGREWIEIYNTGGSAQNLSNWKLVENGVNHNLDLIAGSFMLEGTSYAIIADNPTSFLADYSNYTGTLLDSSFSLSNSGEYLALSEGTINMSELNYSNTWGGGNGYSLELLDTTLNGNPSSNWNTSLVPGGTPGRGNSRLPSCVPLLQNTSWSEWSLQTECFINDTFIQNRSLAQYDGNNCGITSNSTFWEYQSSFCDYCLPVWEAVNTSCQQDDSITRWYNDSKGCYAKTNLTVDLEGSPANITSALICDYDLDGIIGNVSHLNTSISRLSLERNESVLLLRTGNATILEIPIRNVTFNLAAWFLERQANGSSKGFMIVKGMNLEPFNLTKTIYFDRVDQTSTSICVEDAEINSIAAISSSCNEENEKVLSCDGTEQYGYNCEILEDGMKYKVQGLRHSAMIEFSPPSTPVEEEAPAGGGGGGGGGTRFFPQVSLNNSTEDSSATKAVEHENSITPSPIIEREFLINFEELSSPPSIIEEQNFPGNLLTGQFAAGTGSKNDPNSLLNELFAAVIIFVGLAALLLYLGRRN